MAGTDGSQVLDEGIDVDVIAVPLPSRGLEAHALLGDATEDLVDEPAVPGKRGARPAWVAGANPCRVHGAPPTPVASHAVVPLVVGDASFAGADAGDVRDPAFEPDVGMERGRQPPPRSGLPCPA